MTFTICTLKKPRFRGPADAKNFNAEMSAVRGDPSSEKKYYASNLLGADDLNDPTNHFIELAQSKSQKNFKIFQILRKN